MYEAKISWVVRRLIRGFPFSLGLLASGSPSVLHFW